MKAMLPMIILALAQSSFSADSKSPQPETERIEKKSKMDSHEKIKKVTFKDFFPEMTGPITKDLIALPSDYEGGTISEELASGGQFVWATPDDFRAIISGGGGQIITPSFAKAKAPYFLVSFDEGVTLDRLGNFEREGHRLSEKKEQGAEWEKVVEGSFHGKKETPVLVRVGHRTKSKAPVAELYLYSDKHVMCVTFGNLEQDKKNYWRTFVDSFEIK